MMNEDRQRIKIKICGITNIEDYRDAVALGADYAGFIFYPDSPRYVSPTLAVKLASEAPEGNHQKVGVFVNEDIDVVRDIYDCVGLDIVQLHGDESPEYVERLGLPCWKAIRVKDRDSLEGMENYPCETILLDTYKKGMYGGTGMSFDPELAVEAAGKGKRIIVSGGIGEENIEEVLKLSNSFYGIDINSSIEETPGKKSRTKMERMFKKIFNHEGHEGHEETNNKKFCGGSRGELFQKLPPGRRRRFFGEYGGRYVPEMLVPALDELEKYYMELKDDEGFGRELTELMANYSGRPTPLYFAGNLTRRCGGCKIYLKQEGLNHTGAHKINNVLGQGLLAKRMGKSTVIAETGAGQHGLATASVAAKMGLKCKVFMGEVDIRRQYPNVYAMKLMGAEVIPVSYGTRTLKDAVNAALKHWIEHLEDTHYLLGSALGPFPYPLMVRDFQSVIGREVRQQLQGFERRLPDVLVACVGGGSNSLGLFHPFLEHDEIEFIGVEAGGRGPAAGDNAVRFGGAGRTGIVQGYKSYFLQDEHGQVLPTHSISAGLDYAGIGPELAYLRDQGKVRFESVTDKEALEGFQVLCREEGIIPALESAHAVAYALKAAPGYHEDKIMVINLSGRGDKDIFITAKELDRENWLGFLEDEVKHG
jgi:tryptophan synthase beta chain